jgi:hypothetical protein
VLRIEPGLAVNRSGQALALRDPIDLQLVKPTTPISAGAGIFGECQPVQSGTYVAGKGVYLLTIMPAEGREGRAPASGLGNGAAPCNTDTILEAVKFRHIHLNAFLNDGELDNQNLLRNRVAYRCFGVKEMNAFLANPFGPLAQRYGLIDQLREEKTIGNCDVPLAIFYWTDSGGVEFVDMWAARRRLTKRTVSVDWAPLVDDLRGSEGEAMFLQFQEQVGELFSRNPVQTSFVANQNFRYLPPVGIIPEVLGTRRNGFDYRTFFTGVTYREPVYIEGARVEPLIRQAVRYTALDLTSGEMLWLHYVRENRQAIDRGKTNAPQSYLIFSSGHAPFFGEARFDVARWNYSNYA